jgi:predicted DNA-binding WGR domain protein
MHTNAQRHFWVNPAKARYYQVHLDCDLLGDWTLRRVWGGLGSRLGRMQCTGVGSYADGLAEVQAIAKRRAQRGYQEREGLSATNAHNPRDEQPAPPSPRPGQHNR